MSREYRALHQRILFIGHEVQNDPSKETITYNFSVIGASGSHYQVSLTFPAGTLTCTCSDYVYRRQRCKHIYFLIARVFRHPEWMHLDVLDITQVKSILESLNQYYVHEQEKFESKALQKEEKQKDKPNEEDEDPCLICYEMILEKERTRSCWQCKHAVHAQCFMRWLKHTRRNVCAYCRADWS
jgi:hypothetical protein